MLQEQEQERRRTLPPLEPGATLRLRHPSKLAATLPVQLGTGEKLTGFPPMPPRSTSGAGSWEPLAQPRGARYVFEQRLREVAEQWAAQFPRDLDDEAEDDERTAVAWRGRGGAPSAYCNRDWTRLTTALNFVAVMVPLSCFPLLLLH